MMRDDYIGWSQFAIKDPIHFLEGTDLDFHLYISVLDIQNFSQMFMK